MEQEELGQTEEPTTSAELSGSELVPAPSEETSPAVEEQPTTPDVTDNAPVKEANPFKRGSLIEGVITATSPTLITLDLGDGREGIVTATELERMDPKRLSEDFVVGSTIRVVVVNGRNKEGKTVLSYTAALEESDWETAVDYGRTKEVYNGRVGGYNKGGLIVRFGRIRGFVPQSQISEMRLRTLTGETPESRYAQLINQTIDVKVMEVDRPRNRLILSERAAEREARQARKQDLITELNAGEERDGIVTSLEPFGAFVDIGGAEGLIHITELSHQHITHARQAVSVGEQVRVKVIGVDPDKNRIALSLKSLLSDPWDEISVRYPAGTLVRGTVTKTASFGAFARIDGADNIEGLIHISELSNERVEDPKDVVKKGDVLTLRVLRVDIVEKRLALSLKAVYSSEYLDQDLETAYTHPELVAVPNRPNRAKRARNNEAREAAAASAEDVTVISTETAAAHEPADSDAVAQVADVTPEVTAADVHETVNHVAADASEAIPQVADAVSDETSEASGRLSEVVAEVRERGTEIIEGIRENLAEVGEAAGERLKDVRENLAEVGESAGERLKDVRENLTEVVEEARERGAEIIEDIRERLTGDDEATDAPEETSKPE